MEKLRKLQVVATEGNYNEEEIFTLVDLYTESILIIAKNFDLADGLETPTNTFLDCINSYKSQGYDVIYHQQDSPYNFSNFKADDFKSKLKTKTQKTTQECTE
jgi:hypothetical protein